MSKAWLFPPKDSLQRKLVVQLLQDLWFLKQIRWSRMGCRIKFRGRSTSQSISCRRFGIRKGIFRLCSNLVDQQLLKVWWPTVSHSQTQPMWHLEMAAARMKLCPLIWIQTKNFLRLRDWIHSFLPIVITIFECDLKHWISSVIFIGALSDFCQQCTNILWCIITYISTSNYSKVS